MSEVELKEVDNKSEKNQNIKILKITSIKPDNKKKGGGFIIN